MLGIVLWGAACGALLWAGLAASSPGDPNKRLTAAGNAHARSYLLRMADLPTGSWRSRPATFSQPNPSCVVKHYNLGALTLDGEAGDIYELGAGFPLVESDAHLFVTVGQARRAFSKESTIGFARCLGESLSGDLSGSAGASAAVERVAALRFGGLAAPRADSASTFGSDPAVARSRRSSWCFATGARSAPSASSPPVRRGSRRCFDR